MANPHNHHHGSSQAKKSSNPAYSWT
jgi:hypothetical protein